MAPQVCVALGLGNEALCSLHVASRLLGGTLQTYIRAVSRAEAALFDCADALLASATNVGCAFVIQIKFSPK